MNIEIERIDGVCVVRLHGDLVLGSAEGHLCDRFRELIADGETRVVLDLTRVDAIDSAGIGEIVGCSRRAGEAGVDLKLAVSETGAIRKVLTTTHLDRALDVHADAARAASAFEEPPK